jgi:Bacterial sugar transferase
LRGVRIYDLTDFYERFLFKLPLLNLRDGWLILAHGFDLLHHTIALRAKRVIDLVLSFARIDELPHLWNVLLGEMSFIGPRPERPDFNDELEAAIPYYDLRHLVKPGITGWAGWRAGSGPRV